MSMTSRSRSRSRSRERALALEAVQSDGQRLKYASAALQGDEDIVLAAVKKDGKALVYANDALKSNPGIVSAAIQQNWYALKFAAPELKANRGIVLEAVRKNGDALELAAPELKADRQIVLEAIQSRGQSVIHAAPSLLSDKDIVMAAVQRDCFALQFLSHRGDYGLHGDPDVVLAAVRQFGAMLEYAKFPARGRRDIVLTAVAQYGDSALKWCGDPKLEREIRDAGEALRLTTNGRFGCAREYARAELDSVIVNVVAIKRKPAGQIDYQLATLSGSTGTVTLDQTPGMTTSALRTEAAQKFQIENSWAINFVLPSGQVCKCSSEGQLPII